MLKIVLTHKILGPPKSVAIGLSLLSLMVNPRCTVVQRYYKNMKLVL